MNHRDRYLILQEINYLSQWFWRRSEGTTDHSEESWELFFGKRSGIAERAWSFSHPYSPDDSLTNKAIRQPSTTECWRNVSWTEKACSTNSANQMGCGSTDHFWVTLSRRCPLLYARSRRCRSTESSRKSEVSCGFLWRFAKKWVPLHRQINK